MFLYIEYRDVVVVVKHVIMHESRLYKFDFKKSSSDSHNVRSFRILEYQIKNIKKKILIERNS